MFDFYRFFLSANFGDEQQRSTFVDQVKFTNICVCVEY